MCQEDSPHGELINIMDNTLIHKSHGGVECRICGLNFVPDSVDDQDRHAHEHRVLVCGALPLGVREFLKSYGWAVAFNDGGIERLKENMTLEKQETAKRAVVFAYWTRALSYGVPENDFEQFMSAHFAFVDAKVARDEGLLEKALATIERWGKYAG
jgi:hypothetical protein